MPDVALILAAGRGTRMRSSLAKVLHPLLGRPMVAWCVEAARAAGLEPVVVVNHQEEAVRAALAHQGVRFARQPEPRGTGHAVLSALPELPADGAMIVMAGDCPLLRPETLSDLLAAHSARAVTVLTAILDDGAEYGRVLRDEAGAPCRIVEAAEASPEQRAIREINTGVYAFDLAWLRAVVADFQPHPPKGEIYLTDALEAAWRAGRAGAVVHPQLAEVQGVNDRVALSEARAELQARVLRAHALAGVTFEAPLSTVVEADVNLGEDALVEAGAVLRGATRIGPGARIGAHAVVEDSEIGAGVHVLPHSVLSGARVEAGARVGPFARLRPGAVVEPEAHVGNFVELKNARLRRGAKANHLAYLGDADIGERANIGAGTITCNYDGYQKHRTTIEEGAFIGSNAALVAPVTIGANAIVGAGSVITRSVPADALSVARAPQQDRAGWAVYFRKRARGEGEGR